MVENKKIKTCDKCGKEVDVLTTLTWERQLSEIPNEEIWECACDFCEDCLSKFIGKTRTHQISLRNYQSTFRFDKQRGFRKE